MSIEELEEEEKSLALGQQPRVWMAPPDYYALEGVRAAQGEQAASPAGRARP